MRKSIVLGTLLASLVTLTALMPVAKAITGYYWDSIYFVDGNDIKYAHPSRAKYGISRWEMWLKKGDKLYHFQIDHDTSGIANLGIVAMCGILGIIIGGFISGGYAAAIGGAVGIVLGFIAASAGVVLRDELGCVWFWTSIAFIDWLMANAWWLGPICLINLSLGSELVMTEFLLCGYLRLGSGTIHDAVGAGSPPNCYSLTISAGSGGTTDPSPGTHDYVEGTSVTVWAYHDSTYEFSHWVLDGTTHNGESITVTMNSDHTLEAYFNYVGSGGGGGGGGSECHPRSGPDS